MSDAVRLSSVSKVYRLYRAPIYRFLDLFGLCATDRAHYTEHEALHDVALRVERGEKVAIIGRNGAGKSTMLKVITGLVRPTRGTVQVNGRISNLLQIGSGFHPDFTGRQNVFAGLAHQGIVGREAADLFDEIVDFAEVAEYIDQPMKTYSTGMCSRLMFSSAVVTAPDILIVDEILGVGDAYFAHKSFERMRDLCTHDGTTLLLVTHDVYSAMNLCDRFLWLDSGRVKFDGDGRSAIAMYEASIKTQEEERLRRQGVAQFVAAGPDRDAGRTMHVVVRSRSGFALDAPLAIESIELASAGGSRTTLTADDSSGWALLPESSVGAAELFAGRRARVLRARGSIFHKAEWIVACPFDTPAEQLRVRWAYAGRDIADVVAFTPDRAAAIAAELTPGDGWQEAAFTATPIATPLSLEPQKQIDYGTGEVRIRSVQFLGRDRQPIVQARHGELLTVRLEIRIEPTLADRQVALVVGFARQGSAYNGIAYEPSRRLPDADACVIDVTLDPLRFGSGEWFVSVGIGKPGIYERPVVKYFATDADWHHLLAGRLPLRITSAGGVDAVGCFVVHPAAVTCAPSAEHVAS